MEITIPLFSEVSIKFTAGPSGAKTYPTARLQKGLVLVCAGQDLSEEGVGFGVPVLKRGLQTIFPGGAELISWRQGANEELTVVFKLNLEEKVARPDGEKVKGSHIYAVKNFLAAMIRQLPPSRGVLTGVSNALRKMFGWETVFQEAEFCTNVKLIYTIDRQAGTLNVEVDPETLSGGGISEVIVMNEQGARSFDLYRDAGGSRLQGEEIGIWDKVNAEWATFASETHRLAFTLQQVNGAAVFRGRELIGSRLAWSGFGCSFPPNKAKISYQLRIERLP